VMGDKPYPDARSGVDLSGHRETLLRRYHSAHTTREAAGQAKRNEGTSSGAVVVKTVSLVTEAAAATK
jgi:hypothetical protein